MVDLLKQRDLRGLFLVSFVLNMFMNFQRLDSLLFMLFFHRYMELRDIMNNASTLIGYGVTLFAVWYGYKLSEKVDITQRYKDVLQTILVACLLTPVFVTMILNLFEPSLGWNIFLAFIFDFRVGTALFSGIAVGWLYRGKNIRKAGFNPNIIRIVSAYHLWILARGLTTKLIFSLHINQNLTMGTIAYWNWILSLVGTLVYWAYLYYLYAAGRRIELEEKYLDV